MCRFWIFSIQIISAIQNQHTTDLLELKTVYLATFNEINHEEHETVYINDKTYKKDYTCKIRHTYLDPPTLDGHWSKCPLVYM